MPRRQGGLGREPVVRVVGRALFGAGIAVGNNVDSLALNDQLTTQLSSLSDMYGLYRFVRIRVVLPANAQFNSATAPVIYGVGFTPEALLTNPTTLLEAMQLPYWCAHGVNLTTGSNVVTIFTSNHQTFTVPRKDLMKVGVKWFRTQGKGTETDWETQGTFIFACNTTPATSTLTYKGWIEYECEFTDQLPLASTLSNLRTQVVEELAGQMGKLSVSSSNPRGDRGPAA